MSERAQACEKSIEADRAEAAAKGVVRVPAATIGTQPIVNAQPYIWYKTGDRQRAQAKPRRRVVGAVRPSYAAGRVALWLRRLSLSNRAGVASATACSSGPR